FIIATNNITEFDLAIRRPGRFDRVVQIMPPTCEAKITKKDWGVTKNIDLEGKLRALGVDMTPQIKEQLGDLTYGECDDFATKLAEAPNSQAAITLLGDHWKRCTLQSRVSHEEEVTWEQRCKIETQFNR